jgi:RNA polymerase sigma-70 factor (ECF subfamily)
MHLDENYTAFMKFYNNSMPSIRAYLRQVLPGWEDVDEVLQETCLVLWKKFEQFDPDTNFTAWACVVAKFQVLKYKRKKARDRHVFSEELVNILADEANEKSTHMEQERQALKTCLNKLDSKQKVLTLNAYSGDKSIKEVAEMYGRTATALYKALNRIRTNLLRCIKTEVPSS